MFEPDDFEEEEANQGFDLSNGSKLIAPIIGVLVLLFIGFLAFNYFIGDVKEIDFSAKNLAGKNIKHFTVIISNENGERINTIHGNETIKLRKGTYTAKITSSGYKSKTKSFTVKRNTTIEFELTANLDASLENIPALNETLLAGDNIQTKIKINSNSSKTSKVTLKFGGDFLKVFEKNSVKEKEIELKPGVNEIPLELNLKSKSSLNNYLNKDLTGTISIKESPEITKNYSFKIGYLDKKDFDISETSLRLGEIKAGENKTINPIIISNNNKLIDFKNINLTIEITSHKNTPIEEILSWIELTPTTIPILKANNQQGEQIQLTISIPYSVSNERIKGNIILSFPLKQKTEEKKISFDFTTKEAEIGLELQEFPKETIEITKQDSETVYPSESIEFFLKNSGEIRIENISISRKCDLDEANNWVTLTKTFIEKLEAQENQKITLRINANTSEEQRIPCWLYVSYLNPSTKQQDSIEESFTIKLKSNPDETEE